MQDILLQMRDITKRFPGVTALSDVNFSVRRGEIHCLVGENGAGKSTLMKVLSGVHPTAATRARYSTRARPRNSTTLPRAKRQASPSSIRSWPSFQNYPSTKTSSWGMKSCTGTPSTGTRPFVRAQEVLSRVRLNENPATKIKGFGRGQAPAHRDRQGAGQERQAAHTRRAHRGPQRGRQRQPAPAIARTQAAGRHLHHDLPQA